MRIQHNITAMNSYRNYSINNSALSKNLEKLSSGYKVNRAGDDAAGLAISEKMRAQITGLEGATKNAKDGISLIQTAEGALTEVHSMLNRMTTLAEQSANGTYDNDVDRAQLQKEIESLKSEIDRIADSSNFNGLKLLDGSLASSGGGKAGTQTAVLQMSDLMKAAGTGGSKVLEETAAEKYKATVADTLVAADVAAGDSSTFNISYKDADGTARTLSVTVYGGSGTNPITYSVNGGEVKKSDLELTDGKAAKSDVASILKNVLQDAVGDDFEVKVNNNTGLTVEAKTAGATKFEITGVTKKENGGDLTAVNLTVDQEGQDTFKSINTAAMKMWSEGDDAKYSSDPDEVVFTVDGKKFAFVNAGEQTAAGKALGSDVTLIEVATAKTIAKTDVENMVKAINGKLGYEGASVNGTTDTIIDFKPTTLAGGVGTGGLVLQIGDTADHYNKMTVSIRDIHTSSLGISGIDISSQEGASTAMQKIKDAINLVSDTRGGLGALQNRLDHTINNLGVMRENIQNAESTIRDTDVAEEMMAYTKNSILNQSAQAMLAQANQLPQGVLQLLQ